MEKLQPKAFPVVKTVQGSGQQKLGQCSLCSPPCSSHLITAFMSISRKHACENINCKDGLATDM